MITFVSFVDPNTDESEVYEYDLNTRQGQVDYHNMISYLEDSNIPCTVVSSNW